MNRNAPGSAPSGKALSGAIHPQPTLEAVAARIRKLRIERGWSLGDIEIESQGEIKSVVMGSYERGVRSISTKRLLQIATLFDVPVHQLFPQEYETSAHLGRFTVDQRRTSNISITDVSCVESRAITRFVEHIAHCRGDWNGEILTLRSTDLTTIALMAQAKPDDLKAWGQATGSILKDRL